MEVHDRDNGAQREICMATRMAPVGRHSGRSVSTHRLEERVCRGLEFTLNF